MSNQEFSEGGLWAKKVKDVGGFVEKRLKDKFEGAFTSTSWHSVTESQAPEPESVAESVSTDVLPVNPEDDAAVIPIEDAAPSLISISEEELEATINRARLDGENAAKQRLEAVSYTHLTLPTIYSV